MDDPLLLDEALTFSEFFGQFRRVCIAATEECPLHRDTSWEGSMARGSLDETLHICNESGQTADDSREADSGVGNRLTFPLDHVVDPSHEDVPTFSCLNIWLQFFVIHTAILAFGIPPKTWRGEVQAHPVQLLPDSVIVFE
ncbi:unnamed protein product [Hydatigera taeniaeformis]|uniref:Uncharacterized protein n=1 Tax=Hydatigena taeniaeformis TaxID=6205 RepID=A0A3P7EYJ0_HYDTA|nr:unnamed protein product [Hydatigera taeniaeformis]